MMGLVLAAGASYGVFLLYTSAAFRWRGIGVSPRLSTSAPARSAISRRLAEAGLDGAALRKIAGASATMLLLGSAVFFALFGTALPALVAGCVAATVPLAVHRARQSARLEHARESWPRMIEEIRLQTGALGRSVPQALFEVGRRGPTEMRDAFAAAEREWQLSTDFARTVKVLKGKLADYTADATCETLLVAHELGGNDLDLKLAALAEDRVQDLHGRRDAASKQAGVRFARRFVLVVPLGMALAGLSIGTGKAAYDTPLGQLAVLVGIAVVWGCWLWAGHLLKLPSEERVFGD